jgi:hypothetical protein
MAARARLLGAVRLRDAVHVAHRRQARLQVQLRALRQVRHLPATQHNFIVNLWVRVTYY